MSIESTDVTLFLDKGTPTGIWGQPGLFGTAYLPVDGDGLLTIDPVELRVLRASVPEPTYARPTLRRLLGRANLEAFEQARATGTVAARLGPLPDTFGDPALLLAFTLWWRQWTPLSISVERASLDVALAAARADRPGVAADALGVGAGAVAELVEWMRGRAVLPGALHRELSTLVETAVAVMGPRHSVTEVYRGLGMALDALQIVDADAELAGFEPESLLLAPALAIHLGGASPGELPDFDLDWSRIPSRVLDPAVGFVSLQRDGDHYVVRIPAHPLLTATQATLAGLQASLLDAGSGIPMCASDLMYDAADRAFAGRLPIPDGEAADLVLDVSGPGATAEPAWDHKETRRRRAARTAIRCLAGARQQLAATSLGVDEPDLTWLLDVPVEISDLADDDHDLYTRYLTWSQQLAEGDTQEQPEPLISEMLLQLAPESEVTG